MSNILEELNKLKQMINLTPEEKEKLASMGLITTDKMEYLSAENELKTRIQELADKIADNKDRITDLQIINEGLKRERRNLKARLQTLKARILRGKYTERI